MQEDSSNNICFSVVIPTFNRSQYLRQTIEHLCNQKQPGCKYEIIPVDNKSTDDTKNIIEELSKKFPVPIRYVFESRAGSHFARNAGFRAAKGEIIALIDDDILVEPDWVTNILQLYKDPHISSVGGKILLKWKQGEPPQWFEPYKWVLGEINYSDEIIRLAYPQTINAGNLSIRRDILFKVGGYNPCNAPDDKLIGDGECGLCYKVYQAGGQIYWTPFAVGWHVNDARTITLSYIRNRVRNNGKSDAYTAYRENRGSLWFIIKVLLNELPRIAKHQIQSMLYKRSRSPGYYRSLFTYDAKLAFVLYLLKIKFDPNLKKLVEINDWLNI